MVSPRSLLLVAFAAACGDPPVPLPDSAPFPADGVHFNMTYRDLASTRPGAVLVPDTGVVEALMRGSYHYGFTSNPPRPDPAWSTSTTSRGRDGR